MKKRMKKGLQYLLRLLLCAVLCFVVVWLIVFAGGWKLWESGDPILMEILAALILGVLLCGTLCGFEEMWQAQRRRIEELEARVAELEQTAGKNE